MAADFSTLHNHHEAGVFAAIHAIAPRYPALQHQSDLWVDVACVALNRLPARYIRHAVDFAFFQDEADRERDQRAVRDAVEYAFEFVQARLLLGARA
jgi:hypothetical protein